MAGDVSLLFDVAGGGTLSGDSGAEIQKQLNSIVSEINKSPFEIKFKAEDESLNKMREAVQKITESFGNVRLGSVSVETGSATREIANGVEKITQSATKAASAVGKITASLDENNISSIVDTLKTIKGIDDKGAIALAKSISEVGVTSGKAKAKVEALKDGVKNLISLTVTGKNADGNELGYIFTYDKKTQEVKKAVLEVAAAWGKAKQKSNGAAKTTEKIPANISAIRDEIDRLNKSLRSDYDKVISGIGGESAEGDNASRVQELRNKYMSLMTAVKEYKDLGAQATEENADGIYRLQGELRALISEIAELSGVSLKSEGIPTKRSVQMFKDLSVTLDEISVKSLDSFNQKYNNVFGIQDTSGFNAKLAQLENVRKVINEIIVQGNREITLPRLTDSSKAVEEYKNLEEILKRIGYQFEKIGAKEDGSSFGVVTPIIDKEQVYSVEDAIRALSELIGLKNEFDSMSSVKVAKWSSVKNLGDDVDKAKDKIQRFIDEISRLENKNKNSDAKISTGNMYGVLGADIVKANVSDNMDVADFYRTMREELERYQKTLSGDTATETFSRKVYDVESALKQASIQLQKHEDLRRQYEQSEKANLRDSNTLSKAIVATNRVYKQATEALQKYTAAKNGKSSKQYADIEREAASLKSLEERLHNGTISEQEYIKATNKSRAVIQEATAIIKANGEAHLSLGDKIKVVATKFSQYFGIAKFVNLAWRATRQMVQATIELDDAFTQLKIVTGATDSEMEKFSDTAIKLSKSLGQSVADVTKSIETFSRLGYNLPDASALAEYATILANTASVSTDEATTGLTSIIKGFNLNVADAEHISDVLIQVGQKYAVSAGELMEAFERSGAALNATNVSFEKAAGLIAAANAAVNMCRAA